MGVTLKTNADFSLQPSAPSLREADAHMLNAGSLVFLDFAREDCWNGGTPQNLAADTAQTLAGNPLHPTLGGRTANIRRSTGGPMGLGNENAALIFPLALSSYWNGASNIACAVVWHMINTTPVQWSKGAAVALNAVLYWNGNPYTVTTAGTTGTSPPTHDTGAATNGSATLTWGVKVSPTEYGAIGGQVAVLDVDTTFPADQTFVGVQANGYVSPPENLSGPSSWALLNLLSFGPSGSILNGATGATGGDITDSTLKLQLRASYAAAALYNAVGGSLAANTDGIYMDHHLLAIENLTVSGRSLAEFDAAVRAYFVRNSAVGSQLVRPS